MFWGLELEPGKRYAKVVETQFCVTQAVLDTTSKNSGIVRLLVESEGTDIVLCNLSSKHGILQVPLDLQFMEGENIAFYTAGSEDSTIFLSGYSVDDSMLEDSFDGEEEPSSDEPDCIEGLEPIPRTKRKKEMLTPETENKKIKVDKLEKKATKMVATSPAKDGKSLVAAIFDANNAVKDSDDSEDDDYEEMETGDEEEEEDSSDDDEEDDDDDDDDDDDEEDEESEIEAPVRKVSVNGFKVATPKKQQSPKPQQNEAQKVKSPKHEKLKTPKSESKSEIKIKSPMEEDTPSKKKKNKKNKNKNNDSLVNGDTPKSKDQANKSKLNTPKSIQKKTEEKTPQSAGKLGKSVKAGGVVVEDLTVGQGSEAKAGRMVSMSYIGKLKSNNKVFDSNTKGSGFRFRLGVGEVIKGWDIGVAGMKVGGKRTLVIPPHMGYGKQGAPPDIPPNSTLVFDVEMKGTN